MTIRPKPPFASASQTPDYRRIDSDDQLPSPRDPEEASRSLAEVQELLRRLALVTELALREVGGAEQDRRELTQRVAQAQHLSHLRARLDRLHPADLAFILEALPLEERQIVWDLIEPLRHGEVLLELSGAVRESVIRTMDRSALLAAAVQLDADDLADLAEDLPSDVVEEVRRGLNPEEREQLRAAMSYDADTVGARMEFDMLTVAVDLTLAAALQALRKLEDLPDHTDQLFVVGPNDDRLRGVLPIQRLLTAEPESLVGDVMRAETMTLQALDDIQEAAQAFERYDLVSAPVVDLNGRLIGRLTVASVVDAIRERSESETLAQAGLREDEDIFSTVWESARNRWLWLAVNLATAFFASRVIGAFEGTIERVVALAALMPIVAGIAGNSGNQTMTLFIRSLALGQVSASTVRRLFGKELAIAALNGVVWGGIAGVFAWVLYAGTGNGGLLGLTMMLAMTLNLLLGAMVGMTVPLLLQRLGRDPALGSSVLLTFTTDSMGFFIFLGLATIFFS